MFSWPLPDFETMLAKNTKKTSTQSTMYDFVSTFIVVFSATYHKPNMPGWSWRGIEHPFLRINTAKVKMEHSKIDTCVAGARE